MARSIEEVLADVRRSYCNFCQNPKVEATITIKLKCPKCGKTRLIQVKE